MNNFDLGMTKTEFILQVLIEHEPISAHDIHERFNIGLSTVSGTLTKLKDDGYCYNEHGLWYPVLER